MKISDLFNDIGNDKLTEAKSDALYKLFQEIGRRLFQAMIENKTISTEMKHFHQDS